MQAKTRVCSEATHQGLPEESAPSFFPGVEVGSRREPLPRGDRSASLRILLVTPEISYVPPGMTELAQRMTAKAGGLADAMASLVSAFDHMGADIHVALPHYRRMFQGGSDEAGRAYRRVLNEDRIHLAEDRAFYYRERVYQSGGVSDLAVALSFQREVINNILPRVQPDLIHCNDWMTGLIPAVARRLGIPCVFTLHNIHSERVTMEQLEDRGIDAAAFWENLFFESYPYSYEESRSHNSVDLLCSGLFSADVVNTVSPGFLAEVAAGSHAVVPDGVAREVANKCHAGCAAGILNAPDPSYNPATDRALPVNYGSEDLTEGKVANKLAFQRRTGLYENGEAPLFFWPSRLDPVQKGPQLLTDILHRTVEDYGWENLQIAVVADGPHAEHFESIVDQFHLQHRVCIHPFDEELSRQGFAASDFTLVPSSFEPCGLAQMVALMYGSLPIVHATGGLRDTVEHLDYSLATGNGFVFWHHNPGGLRWAMDQAMEFHRRPVEEREQCRRRVMKSANRGHGYESTASHYGELYGKALAMAGSHP